MRFCIAYRGNYLRHWDKNIYNSKCFKDTVQANTFLIHTILLELFYCCECQRNQCLNYLPVHMCNLNENIHKIILALSYFLSILPQHTTFHPKFSLGLIFLSIPLTLRPLKLLYSRSYVPPLHLLILFQGNLGKPVCRAVSVKFVGIGNLLTLFWEKTHNVYA